ncbi:MBL fold metallo-hydrolase [Rhodococcus sp. 06-462-5]|uniref:MBL fold metallo-hydrolase n=1 Tax=unclassified Rhodococcus (in: high G+C Gram-positive bacteria) TaxID=192944 RepID=UPI000B9AD0E0|nr:MULTISPECIES: MBL fold metallo-hydrolase [unclassified Rhodococcus (in: high G+C Gram-positive bacteria)]OZC73618.1 MBL fold metallo-hydrolase [Rhodococcus sp. 06-462-5]OZE63427.1 MBL fold metallo-hydrolase [Rhodococcus sp. 02-925g]
MTDLTFTTLDTGPNTLDKTITLVSGDTQAVLVDAGFTRADGHRAVAAILDSGKELTTVFISAGDPDFYFGAEVVQDAFPNARFVAPADVIDHIDHSYDKKLESWKNLGVNLPTRRVTLEAFSSDSITVDDQTLELRNADLDPHNRGWFLFDPATRTVVGGVLVFSGLHVWTADSSTPELRQKWIDGLDTVKALNPTTVIAGHRSAGAAADGAALAHTRDYLKTFERIVGEKDSGAEVEKALLAEYPDAGLAVAAHLGALVAKGEMAWG